MPVATFKTNPYALEDLLRQCHKGELQLPDFQRSWVWDEDRIKSLIASVSRGFPIGALMTLERGGEVEFKPRQVEGTSPEAGNVDPQSLLLDGQQRMTSLYQVTIRNKVVETVTAKHKKMKRWFYIDIQSALGDETDREEAIIGVPADRVVRGAFNRNVELDLSSREAEFENLMYPVSQIFDWDDWQKEFIEHAMKAGDFSEKWDVIKAFKEEVVNQFTKYHVPVIALNKQTSKEAICVVFEKVNTGGKALDAFELVTAMYAAEGHELRKDWYGSEEAAGRHRRLQTAFHAPGQEFGILSNVGNTDFLQAISLFHTRDLRRKAAAAGKTGKELPAVSGNRRALLALPLEAYLRYQEQVEQGFMEAAKFLHIQYIYRDSDLPYQSQIVPLATILAEIGDRWHDAAARAKLLRWYWNGVFGELYGSTVESRIAKDFMEVPEWIAGGPEPSTITDATFRADRLFSMRMRLSAAYKGVNALLMREGAKDFVSGQGFSHTVFFDENVDIHHIFPRRWCKDKKNDKDWKIYDSIVNKTPLSFRTNRQIGGDAPSKYLAKLEKGSDKHAPIPVDTLERHLETHLISPGLLRADDFDAFVADRQKRLLKLIENATGISIYRGEIQEEEEDVPEDDGDMAEQAVTLARPDQYLEERRPVQRDGVAG